MDIPDHKQRERKTASLGNMGVGKRRHKITDTPNCKFVVTLTRKPTDIG
jgi:hypothetical protein